MGIPFAYFQGSDSLLFTSHCAIPMSLEPKPDEGTLSTVSTRFRPAFAPPGIDGAQEKTCVRTVHGTVLRAGVKVSDAQTPREPFRKVDAGRYWAVVWVTEGSHSSGPPAFPRFRGGKDVRAGSPKIAGREEPGSAPFSFHRVRSADSGASRHPLVWRCGARI